MGIGHYTQKDIPEAARAFTGWTIDPANGSRFQFVPDCTTSAAKHFLDRYGDFTGQDILATLAARPETAAYLTAKLAFLSQDLRAGLTQTLIDLFASTAGNIREIVRTILLSDDFDQTSQAPDMIKSRSSSSSAPTAPSACCRIPTATADGRRRSVSPRFARRTWADGRAAAPGSTPGLTSSESISP